MFLPSNNFSPEKIIKFLLLHKEQGHRLKIRAPGVHLNKIHKKGEKYQERTEKSGGKLCRDRAEF